MKRTIDNSFNLKIKHRIKHDRSQKLIDLEDKLKAKIRAIALGVPVTELYWAGRDLSKLAVDDVPQKFVIKTNHFSGPRAIKYMTKDELLDRDVYIDTKKHFTTLLRSKYRRRDEWAVQNIKPYIMIEEYIEEHDIEYKCFVFNGETACIAVYRFLEPVKADKIFYDTNWNLLKYIPYNEVDIQVEIPKPDCLDEMVSYANKFGTDIDFIRVDFYIDGGVPKMGETSCYPAGGNLEIDDEFDSWLASKWKTE